MKLQIKKYLPEAAGVIAGGIAGFLYWKYVGCQSGTCAIKSNWYLMVPWGMLLGYLIVSLVKDTIVKYSKKKKG